MKIIFLTNSFGTGGAERQILDLAKELIRKGHEVKLITLKSKPSDLLKHASLMNHSSLGMDSYLGYLSSYFKYKKTLEEFNPDIVHAHLPHSIIFSRILSFVINKKYKLICTTHNYNIRSNLFAFLYKITDFLSDFNTNVSQSAIDRYIKEGLYKKSNSKYVPNGFNVDFSTLNRSKNRNFLYDSYGILESDFLCVAMGRLHHQKNYVMMLKSISVAKKKNPSIKLIILGDGPDRNALINLRDDLKLQNNVFFTGVVDEVNKYLSVCDLFLMTSVFEGMPLAICEAMLAELPMVVTDFIGVNEFVKEYYPIVAQDDHLSFGHEILLSVDRDFSEQIIAAKSNIEENYSINNIVDIWLTIYNGKM